MAVEYIDAIREIPDELRDDFTLNGKIPIIDYYFNDTNIFYVDGRLSHRNDYEEFYSEVEVNKLIEKVKNRQYVGYENTDPLLYQALEKYSIENKQVVIIGSERPSYESICVAFGGRPITIEYIAKRFGGQLMKNIFNRDGSIQYSVLKNPIYKHPSLTFYTVDEFETNTDIELSDASFSISSIEHDGLGRYGDPLDPWADLKSMKKLKEKVKKGGLLYLAAPIGPDVLFWNGMRQYGRIRFPMLIEGWELVESFGFNDSDMDKMPNRYFYPPTKQFRWICFQPVFVLRNT